MARQVITHKIEREGRDRGKVFIITEMSATAAHCWATRAIFGIMNGGVDIPDDVLSQGMAGLAAIGLNGLTGIPYAVAGHLLKEMLQCAQIKEQLLVRPFTDDDVEEAMTLFELQRIALTMHLQPFISGGTRTSESPPTTPAAAS